MKQRMEKALCLDRLVKPQPPASHTRKFEFQIDPSETCRRIPKKDVENRWRQFAVVMPLSNRSRVLWVSGARLSRQRDRPRLLVRRRRARENQSSHELAAIQSHEVCLAKPSDAGCGNMRSAKVASRQTTDQTFYYLIWPIKIVHLIEKGKYNLFGSSGWLVVADTIFLYFWEFGVPCCGERFRFV